MKLFRVIDLCAGPHCVSVEEGEKVHQIIVDTLNKNETLTLDFDGVLTLTSSFLNSAIGKLYGEFETSKIEKSLKITGLDKDDVDLKEIVIKNAIEFYAKDQKAKEMAKDIIKDLKEDN